MQNTEIPLWIENNKNRCASAWAPCVNCNVGEQDIDGASDCEDCLDEYESAIEYHCSDCQDTANYGQCWCDEMRRDCKKCTDSTKIRDYSLAVCDYHGSRKCDDCYRSDINGYYKIIYDLLINDKLQPEDIILSKGTVYKKLLKMHLRNRVENDKQNCNHKSCHGLHPKYDKCKKILREILSGVDKKYKLHYEFEVHESWKREMLHEMRSDIKIIKYC